MLSVRNLRLEVPRGASTIVAVDDVSFDVAPGEILGIAGESGAGKSLTLKSIIGLVPAKAKLTGGLKIDLDGNGLQPYSPQDVRGRGVSFIFQEPMTALNPTMRVGDLIAEGPRVHQGLSRAAARALAVEFMDRVGIPDAQRRARSWPHQLSGGLRQRVMIAVALSTNPKLLLCDEPTTALDVSLQDQILRLLRDLRERDGISIVFVSHDLAVLGELCDRLIVMYAGRVAESGPIDALFRTPQHPYTAALARSVPSLDRSIGALATIPGLPPDSTNFPPGCRFAPRCGFAQPDCLVASNATTEIALGHTTACIHPEVLQVVTP